MCTVIDFVKVEIVGVSVEEMLNNDSLEFIGEHNEQTGELSSKHIAVIYGMEVIVYDSGYIFVKGSIHKYFNFIHSVHAPNQRTEILKMKGFNGNDFNYSQLIYACKHLASVLSVEQHNMRLRNIEIGVNVSHGFKTKMILSYLMRHNGKGFSNPLSRVLTYRRLNHQQYALKCYDKKLQYSLGKEVLRFEIHFSKMTKLNTSGLHTVSDLLSHSMLNYLKQLLLQRWEEILIYDYTISDKKLTAKQKIDLLKYKNPTFWNVDLMPNQIYRHKKNYQGIEQENSRNVKQNLKNLISHKWEELSAF
jgi:hypothetical protein